MDCSQDSLGFDSELNRINSPRERDPVLPVLPSPNISEELLESGLNTPPVTPLHSPHIFLEEERWLFSPPPIVTVKTTYPEVETPPETSDTAEIGLNPTPLGT